MTAAFNSPSRFLEVPGNALCRAFKARGEHGLRVMERGSRTTQCHVRGARSQAWSSHIGLFQTLTFLLKGSCCSCQPRFRPFVGRWLGSHIEKLQAGYPGGENKFTGKNMHRGCLGGVTPPISTSPLFFYLSSSFSATISKEHLPLCLLPHH